MSGLDQFGGKAVDREVSRLIFCEILDQDFDLCLGEVELLVERYLHVPLTKLLAFLLVKSSENILRIPLLRLVGVARLYLS